MYINTVLTNSTFDLSTRFLPVSATIETTVKVEVQHDHNVHPGVCLDGWSLQLCEVLIILCI